MSHKLLGQILIQKKIITEEQLKKALEYQTMTGYRLGHCLMNLGFLKEDDLIETLSLQLHQEFKKINSIERPVQILENISEEFCKKNVCMPVKVQSNKLIVALADPDNISIRDDLKLLTGKEVESINVIESNIFQLINKYYGDQESVKEQPDGLKDKSDIISFVNEIIFEAIEKRASDIHIENYGDKAKLRYRIDGYLYQQKEINIRDVPAIISRIKIMSDLNIAENRIPQDGRIVLQSKNYNVDIRVSIIPGIYGENVVLRILDKEKFIPDLDNLGLEKEQLALLKKVIHKPYGLILVSGPTGSGKTTTLYSILKTINSIDKKILTIEDPVEYKLDNITQVEVKPGIGFDFARGLRSFLRHDPDIIMVGEIRDYETAEIAIRASLTGHLVLSTVHTNDAASAITRLLDMRIEPFLVSSTTVLVMAQRLVRKLCDHCTSIRKKSSVKKKRQKGCKECNETGYKGRVGIFEVMEITSQIKELIMKNRTAEEIKVMAKKSGMSTMNDNGMKKVKRGITNLEEVQRVI